MTVQQAMEGAAALRPNHPFAPALQQQWLRELDGALRLQTVSRSVAQEFDGIGADCAWADGLAPDAALLLPEPFDAAYPHWLAAQIDLALGEGARYANELAVCNSTTAAFAAWLRRTHPPRAGGHLRTV